MKRLRIKLTAFNTLITGTILLCLTVLCLGISEESGRAEAFQNFGTQLATAATYLQGQERVRMQWFSQLESAGNLHAAVTDGGYPLFSVGFDPERTGSAADMARVIAAREYGMPKGSQSFSCIFSMTAEDGTDYFAAVAKIPKGDSALELTLLRPLEDLEQRFVRQRLRVGLGAAVAVGLLGTFSWCFTGRVLRPVAESRQRQNRFIAAASHELRTPIAVIQGYANMLDRWGKDDPAVRQEAISAIRAEADSMATLVEQLLFLARGDNNTQTVHFKAFDLSAVVDEVYRETELLETGRQVGSAIQPGIRFYGDTGLLKQALRILVDNAVKYTPEGGALFVRLKGKEGIVQLSVSDTGQGIAPDDLPKVFQRFYRTDESRTRQTGGTGLGLSIAQWTAARHGGWIQVSSKQGLGSRFTLVLPWVEQPAEEIEETA